MKKIKKLKKFKVLLKLLLIYPSSECFTTIPSTEMDGAQIPVGTRFHGAVKLSIEDVVVKRLNTQSEGE